MGGVGAVVAIMVLVGFLGGIMAGIILIVSVASRREDRRYSLTSKAPDATCRGARWLTGARVCGDRFLSSDMRQDQPDELGAAPPDHDDIDGELPRWPRR